MRLFGKKEEKEKKEGDRAICGTLCICQALAVLSTVSIIYLSVIIYLPAKRELESGIGETPVMCTTIESRHIANDIDECRRSSCAEWCLSKGGGSCDHLYVSVRQNGTDVDFEDCTEVVENPCPVLSKDKNGLYNCKKDNQCTSLNDIFMCELGVCRNITDVFSCDWRTEDEEAPLNCFYKRNCVELDGMYSCTDGLCARLLHWKCERQCQSVSIRGHNLITMAGDTIISAYCRLAVNSRSGLKIWEAEEYPGTILVSSCTTLEVVHNNEVIRGADCVNGSTVPLSMFPEASTNFTYLMNTFQAEGWKHKLDMPDKVSGLPRGTHMPFDQDVMIYNRTMLYINHEGCVNTLQDECDLFYADHGQDSRNQSFPSRFPCYYAADKNDFVVRRYDLVKTKLTFLMFFTVPAVIFVTSCLVLAIISNCVGVRRSGTMAIMPKFYCCRTEERQQTIKMKILRNSFDEIAEEMEESQD